MTGINKFCGLAIFSALTGCGPTHNNNELTLQIEQTSKKTKNVMLEVEAKDEDGLVGSTLILTGPNGEQIKVFNKKLDGNNLNENITINNLEPGTSYEGNFTVTSINGSNGKEETKSIVIPIETAGIDSKASMTYNIKEVNENNSTIELNINDADGIKKVTIIDSNGEIVEEFILKENSTNFKKEIKLNTNENYQILVDSINGETKEVENNDLKEFIFNVDPKELKIDENKKGYIGKLPEGSKILGESGPFYIKDGILKTKEEFDYETKNKYEFYIFYTDKYNGNTIVKKVKIEVVDIDENKPTITLNGPSTITLTVGDEYVEQGATANDKEDLDLTKEIKIDNSSVDTSVAGTYIVTYTVSDSAGNDITVTRTVEVNQAPTAQDGDFPGNSSSPYTFNIDNLISDNESPNSELSVEIVTQPTGTDGNVWGNTSVNGTDITINLNDGEAGTIYIEYKVKDPQGAESEKKKITVNDMNNA